MKKFKWFYVILIIGLIVNGCKGPLSSMPETPDALPSVTAYSFIDELKSSLTLNAAFSNLTESEITSIAAAARSAVGENTADINGSVDKIISGSLNSLSGLSSLSTSELKLGVIDQILTSIMASIKDHKDVTLTMAGRAIDPYAASMDQILANISAAAIRNLSNAGLEPDEIADAAKSTVTSLVGALDDGGIKAEEVPSAIQMITLAAVQNISETDGSSLVDAVNSITEGAVTAIGDIEVDGFNDSMISEVVGGITSGATEGIELIAEDVAAENTSNNMDAVTTLAAGIASSAIAGVDILAETSLIDVGEIVGVVTEEAIKAVSEVEVAGVDTSASNIQTQEIIGSITGSTSTAAINMLNSTATDEEVLIAIVTGASDGALSIDQSFDDSALEAAIKVDSDGTGTTEPVANLAAGALKDALTIAVDDGIAKAENEAPAADSGINQTADVDQLITLDGSGSSDPEDEVLTYEWFIASYPDGNSVSIINADQSEANITPNIAGIYTIGLKVTDIMGDSDTSYMTVSVAIDIYEGLTAQERIDNAVALKESGNPQAAVTEFNTILDHYLPSSIFGRVYLERGRSLWGAGDLQSAFDDFTKVKDDYSSLPDVYYAGLIELGWMTQTWDSKVYADAVAYFNEVIADYSGTKYEAAAYGGRGWNSMNAETPDFTAAGSDFDVVIAHSETENAILFYALLNKGELEIKQSNFASARIEWNNLLTLPENAEALINDYSGLKDYGKIYQVYNSIAWSYMNEDDTSSAISTWQNAINHSGMSARYKTKAYKQLGNRYREQGDDYFDSSDTMNGTSSFETAELNYNLAWTNSIGTNESEGAWAYNDLAWMYRNWMNYVSGTEKDSILTKYLNTINSVLTGNTDEVKVDVLMNRGEYYFWDADTRDLDSAESDFYDALDIALANDLPNEAWARLRIAHVNKDKGWENHQETGVNWEGFFHAAIDQYEVITAVNFPDLNEWMLWILPEAKSSLANCYQGLGEYGTAISILENIIANPDDFRDEDIAWITYDLGRTYTDQGRDYHNNGFFSQAIAAFESSIIYLNGALSLESDVVSNNQRFLDDVNGELGESYKNIGFVNEDNDNMTDAHAAYTAAISYYENVSENMDEWRYLHARMSIAECYRGLNDYDGSRTALQFLLDNFVLDIWDEDEINMDLARTYREEYRDLRDAPGEEVAAETAYGDGVILYSDLIQNANTDETKVYAAQNLGYLIRDHAHSSDYTSEEFDAEMNQAINIFDSARAIANNVDENSNMISGTWLGRGDCERDLADSYGNSLGWDINGTYEPSVYRSKLALALISYANAYDMDTLGNIDSEYYNEGKESFARANFDMANSYDLQNDDIAEFETYINVAMDLGNEVLSDSDANAETQAGVMINFGSIHIRLRGRTVGGQDFNLSNSLFWYNQILGNPNYNDLDQGHFGAQAQAGLGQAHKADGDDMMSASDYAEAIVSYHNAISEFLLVSINTPDDQWILNDAEWDLEESYFSLADAYTQNGDIQDASDTYDIIINMGTDRQGEAQNYKDNLVFP